MSVKGRVQKAIFISTYIGAWLITPSIAFAQTKTCNVLGTACTTDALKANAQGNWLNWNVENAIWCDSHYKVFDIGNNVTISSGYIGTGKSRGGRINGLFGSYKLEITSSCFDTIGSISN